MTFCEIFKELIPARSEFLTHAATIRSGRLYKRELKVVGEYFLSQFGVRILSLATQRSQIKY